MLRFSVPAAVFILLLGFLYVGRRCVRRSVAFIGKLPLRSACLCCMTRPER
jgi:hypothetical protein